VPHTPKHTLGRVCFEFILSNLQERPSSRS
jgi:hypothetical protein